jgi:DNA-binding transcriptional LysR family regulator
MDMRRMRYFLTLAEHRHFGRAAGSLGISQPALSQQVRRLEEEFSAVLIERSSRNVELTAAGAAIVTPVRKCLAAYDEAVLAAHKAGEQTAGRLRIGFPGAEVGWALLPSLLRKISERLPEAKLEVVEASCGQQASDLMNERIDAGFMHLPVADDGLAALRVRQDELVVLLPRNHPSAAPDCVPLGCLADEPFIDFRVHCTAYSQALSSLIHRSGISPRIEYGSTGLATTLEMVASRLGVAIALGSAVHQVQDQVIVRRLRPSGKSLDIAFVWRPSNNSAELRKLRHLIDGLGVGPVTTPDTQPGQAGFPDLISVRPVMAHAGHAPR